MRLAGRLERLGTRRGGDIGDIDSRRSIVLVFFSRLE